MEIPARTTSALSLEHFESFIAQHPDAKNIVISNDGHITESFSVFDQDQARTKEAFKAALKAKYPDQEDLVDEAWNDLRPPQKSWDAHTIRQVIDKAAKNESEVGMTWRNVEGNGEKTSEETMQQLAQALDDYAEKVVEKLSSEEKEALRQQLATSGFAVAGAGVVGLAANLSTPTANHALANLIATISSSLPHATALPIMGAAAPGSTHLAAAVAMMGASATAATSAAATASAGSTQAAIAAAAPAIATFIIAGAIAHRLYIAARRVSTTMHRIEHEVNNISVAIIAAAFATIPPAQHPILVGAIIGGIAGQHLVDPGMIEQAFHNMRDAALGVYLFNHPEVAVTIGNGLKSLLLSAGKSMVALSSGTTVTTSMTAIGGGAGAVTTTTGVAATTAVTGAASSTSTGVVATQGTSTALAHHSIAATATHGVSAVVTTIAGVAAAHPAVTAAIIVGGACMAAARRYLSSSTSSEPQTA